jgi:serine phosphatase RsbU (regulator of sigma subunit)
MQHIPLTPYSVTDGASRSSGVIDHTPLTVGRLPDRDLILENTYVSRQHAEIFYENGSFHVADKDSRHGTFVNGIRVRQQRLALHDMIHFGSMEGPMMRFGVDETANSSTIRDLIGQLPSASRSSSELEKLRWFLEAARRLNAVGAVDQILASLVETTLELTKVERGYFFLREESGKLKLAAGLNSKGETLTDESTLSRSAIQQAIQGSGEFIITDTLKAEIAAARSESMIMQNIRTIICIPLRSRRTKAERGQFAAKGDVLGVLYLDSRLHAGNLTPVDNDLLHTIASEAAALIDNAQLAIAEEHARRDREELNIAASIQQGLMTVKIPDLPYAQVSARSIPCKEIGGDFYDVIADDDHIYLVIADVSGKGVSAALLASTLQGLIYSQLVARQPLETVAALVNQFICAKNVGKYATMCILKLSKGGQLDYIVCGHPYPLVCTGESVQQLQGSNLPVGMIDWAEFSSNTTVLAPGTRVFLVTDGVTEAENVEGEFFGDDRLEQAFGSSCDLNGVAQTLQAFCGTTPANDDCTMLEVLFR